MYKITRDSEISRKSVTFFGIIAVILSAIASMTVPYITKVVIDNILSENGNLITMEIIGIIAILIFSQIIIFYFGNYIVEKLLLNYREKLVEGIFKKSLSMSSPDYLEEDSGKVHNLYYGYSNTLASSLINYNILLPGFIVQALITFAVLFYISPRLSIISVLACPFYLIFVVWNAKKRSSLNQDCINSNDRFVKTTNIFKNHIVDMHMVNNDSFFYKKFTSDLSRDIKTTQRYHFWFHLGNRLPTIIQLGIPIIILWLGGKYVNTGVMTLGTLIMFSQYIGYLFEPLTNTFHVLTEIKSMKPYYQVYESFYYKNSYGKEKYQKLFGPIDGIEVKNASIYSGGDKFLYEANFKLKDKGLYIIKGPNGSGKSTILKILSGIYSSELVKGGDVIINRDFSNEISMLQYPLFFFNGTILENIRCGRDNELVDIFDMKDLGKEITADKINLSSGEQQKVALSRVFTENRKVVFLDEPFSNLEAAASERLKSYISGYKNEKLVVVIMHDDSLDEYADAILSIENGTLK